MASARGSREIIFDHIARVLLRSSVHNEAPISEATELYYDLGLAGDDLADVIDAIRAPFGTNFSGMDLRRYAPNEVTHNFGLDLGRAFQEWRGERTYQSLTVADLITAVAAGAWRDR